MPIRHYRFSDVRWILTERRAHVLGLLLILVGGYVGLSRAFSVSCRGQDDCLSLREIKEGVPLPEAIHLYDGSGRMYAEVAGPLRRALPADEIPRLVSDAFVAVEDRRFWDHGGVDSRGVLRAAFRNLRSVGISEGASTIPMQLVRTLWAEPLRGVGPWRRKVIEARTAPRLIDELGHGRVLALYLNSIYLGNGLYGVERAAQHYFGTGVDSLSLGQVATLVGMTRSPEYYDPYAYPERARAVRDLVLGTLAEAGIVPTEEAEAAAALDLDLAESGSVLSELRRRSHLTAAVMRELRRVAPDLAGRPGLVVHSTIDARIQAEAEGAIVAQLTAIESGRYGLFEPGDSLSALEAAAVAIDPGTGSVLAWVGGRDFGRSEFDRVEQARRQVGSLVKPFLVAVALERGDGITDLVSSDTASIETDDGPWMPADHVLETSLPLREALVRSSNRAAAHLGSSLGIERVAQFATRAGLSGPVPLVPSSSIGAFDASLLEMTAAYASFGNGGMRIRPHLIERIEGQDHSVLWARTDTLPPARVMDERVAFVVLDAMRAVVDRGTGYPIRSAGYWGPAAGKTGTTNEGRDAWFVGLTPAVAAGVWVGFDQPRAIVSARGGGDLAAPAWGAWMRGLERTPRSVRAAWIPPTGVQLVRYDAVTGEVLEFDCDVQLGMGYYEAWVMVGRYQTRGCGWAPNWMRRLWHTLAPPDPTPLRPVVRRGVRR